MKIAVSAIALVVSFALSRAQESSGASATSSKDEVTLREMRVIGKFSGVENAPASESELTAIARQYGEFLFNGETSSAKFRAVSRFCDMMEASPDKKKLIPLLRAAISSLKAPAKKISEVRNWEESAIRSGGDRIGLLMSCAIDIDGEGAFNALFDEFVKEKQQAKAVILLEVVAGRKDRAGYLNELSMRLKDGRVGGLDENVKHATERIQGHDE